MNSSRQVIVRKPHPRRKPLIIVASIVAVIVLAWLAFEYGRSRAGFDSEQASKVIKKFSVDNEALNQRNQKLVSDTKILNKRIEIDRIAYQDVEKSLFQYEDEIKELKKEILFYRGIVGPGSTTHGLQIKTIKIFKNTNINSYRFRIILTQYLSNRQVISGVLQMAIVGVSAGKTTQLSQGEILKSTKHTLKFRFKYFQEIDGDIVIPEKFVPIRVILKAIPRGKSRVPVEQSYQWTDLVI